MQIKVLGYTAGLVMRKIPGYFIADSTTRALH